MRHLIAAENCVVPRRLPHADALCERLRDVQVIAGIETENQQRQAGDRHPHAAARDDVRGEKDAAEKQGRTQIFLKKEEDERQAHAGEDRQDVLTARQVDPSRPSRIPERRAVELPEQFPSAGEEACEKQREQQTDRFNRLHRAQIDLRAARSRTGTEKDQQRRQRQRDDERQVTQLHEPRGAEVDERHGRHHHETDDRAFREADERQAVAQRIGATEEDGKTDRRQQMRDRDQQRIGSDAAQPPHEHRDMKGQNVDTREQQHLAAELSARSNAEKRFQFRKDRCTEQRRDRAHIRQRALLLSFVDEESKQLLRRQTPIVHVGKDRLHRSFERCGVGHRVQVDRPNGGGRALRAVEDARASRIGQRNRQDRDARRCRHRDR